MLFGAFAAALVTASQHCLEDMLNCIAQIRHQAGASHLHQSQAPTRASRARSVADSRQEWHNQGWQQNGRSVAWQQAKLLLHQAKRMG